MCGSAPRSDCTNPLGLVRRQQGLRKDWCKSAPTAASASNRGCEFRHVISTALQISTSLTTQTFNTKTLHCSPALIYLITIKVKFRSEPPFHIYSTCASCNKTDRSVINRFRTAGHFCPDDTPWRQSIEGLSARSSTGSVGG